MYRFIKTENILAFSDYQDSDARNKINNVYLNGALCQKRFRLRIETFRKQIESVLMEKFEFEYRKKVKTSGSLLISLKYQNSAASHEMNAFQN